MSISNEILLDWDKISFNEAIERISKIKKYDVVKSIEIRMSPTNGYHIYIELIWQMHQEELFRYRKMWKDDGNRLMMDCFWRLGNEKNNSDVMFIKKRKHGIVWYEVPLFLYSRDNKSRTWHKMNLQKKNSQICMLEQSGQSQL